MTPPIIKPVADPMEDIDRVAPVDSMMARQDRADLPGNRSDQPGNEENDPDRNELGADLAPRAAGREPDDVPDPNAVDPLSDDDEIDPEIDPDVDLAIESLAGDLPGNGPDDDEPVEETERLGDDSRTGPG